jgi:hypothetical protein
MQSSRWRPAAILLLAGGAGTAPAAWAADGQTLADRSNTCQVQVPADWTLHPGVMASATSPAGDERVQLEPVLAKVHVDYAQRRAQLAKDWRGNAGFTVLQSDDARTLLRFTNGMRVQWAALSAGPTVCEASLSARHADDAVIPRIAASLHAVHP